MIFRLLAFYFNLLAQVLPFTRSALVNYNEEIPSIINKMMQDPVYLDDILSQTDQKPSIEKINAFQHIPQLLITVARRGDVDTFKKIIDRPDLVDWQIENRDRFHLPMNYRIHMIHLGDIEELAKLILFSDPPQSDPSKAVSYNFFQPEIVELFADLILKNLHHIQQIKDPENSSYSIIFHYLQRYHAYYGKEKDYGLVLDHSSRLGIDIHLQLTLSSLYAVQNHHVSIISLIKSKDLLDFDLSKLLFRFACIRGNVDLVDHPFSKIRKISK